MFIALRWTNWRLTAIQRRQLVVPRLERPHFGLDAEQRARESPRGAARARSAASDSSLRASASGAARAAARRCRQRRVGGRAGARRTARRRARRRRPNRGRRTRGRGRASAMGVEGMGRRRRRKAVDVATAAGKTAILPCRRRASARWHMLSASPARESRLSPCRDSVECAHIAVNLRRHPPRCGRRRRTIGASDASGDRHEPHSRLARFAAARRPRRVAAACRAAQPISSASSTATRCSRRSSSRTRRAWSSRMAEINAGGRRARPAARGRLARRQRQARRRRARRRGAARRAKRSRC